MECLVTFAVFDTTMQANEAMRLIMGPVILGCMLILLGLLFFAFRRNRLSLAISFVGLMIVVLLLGGAFVLPWLMSP